MKTMSLCICLYNHKLYKCAQNNLSTSCAMKSIISMSYYSRWKNLSVTCFWYQALFILLYIPKAHLSWRRFDCHCCLEAQGLKGCFLVCCHEGMKVLRCLAQNLWTSIYSWQACLHRRLRIPSLSFYFNHFAFWTLREIVGF